MTDREKPSWRERDRRKDRSAHRPDEPAPRGAPARVATATAQYKRQLEAVFSGGELPAHLKDKLAQAEGAPAATEGETPAKARVRLVRAVQKAASGPDLVKALDALRAHDGAVPDDLELVVRFLEHPADAVLAEALTHLERAVELATPLPKASRKTLVARLEGVAVTSFDPRVQGRAATLAQRLK